MLIKVLALHGPERGPGRHRGRGGLGVSLAGNCQVLMGLAYGQQSPSLSRCAR